MLEGKFTGRCRFNGGEQVGSRGDFDLGIG